MWVKTATLYWYLFIVCIIFHYFILAHILSKVSKTFDIFWHRTLHCFTSTEPELKPLVPFQHKSEGQPEPALCHTHTPSLHRLVLLRHRFPYCLVLLRPSQWSGLLSSQWSLHSLDLLHSRVSVDLLGGAIFAATIGLQSCRPMVFVIIVSLQTQICSAFIAGLLVSFQNCSVFASGHTFGLLNC